MDSSPVHGVLLQPSVTLATKAIPLQFCATCTSAEHPFYMLIQFINKMINTAGSRDANVLSTVSQPEGDNACFCHTLPKIPQDPSDCSLSSPLPPPPPYWSIPRDPDYRQEGLVRTGFLRARWGNHPLPKGILVC